MPRIGELLIAEGLLSEGAVQSALGYQRHTGEPFRLGTILLDRDLLGEESLLKALSVIHRCDYVTWQQILRATPHIVRILPERAAVRLAAFPYALEGRGVRVAFKNPSNLAAVDEVSALTGRPVIPAVITEVRLLHAFHLFHGRPVPIEFRSVLQKLERKEERRLYRTRATQLTAVALPAAEAPRKGREIPISFEGRTAAATAAPASVPVSPAAPASFAAPFLQAESELRDSEDVAGLLPDFTPPRAESPDERAAGMWTDAVPVPSSAATSVEHEIIAPDAPPAPEAPAPTFDGGLVPHAFVSAEGATGRDEIAESALDALASRFPRVLLLVSGQDAIQGWTGRGSRLTRSRVSHVRVAWGEPSIFAFVKLSGSSHRGGLSRILLPPELAALIGDKGIASCAVLPVRIKDRLVAFLYADRAGAPMSDADHRALEAAASTLGSNLARLLLELRKSAPAS